MFGDQLRLAPHTSARDQAVSTKPITPGSIIITVPACSTALLLSEKGHRCDLCHRRVSSLRKCSGCASFWYCDSSCQRADWSIQHKHICKRYNQFTVSPSYQKLAPHEKMDAILLSLFLASMPDDRANDSSSPYYTFMSLLPGPSTNNVPPLCSKKNTEICQDVFSRFGNNNFTIHSHLVSIAHGVFPLASRLFNHSCQPNAVVRYQFTEGKQVTMEVVAITHISKDEEICLPYLDPALLQSRQKIFHLTYGFSCTCVSCQQLASIDPIPKPPEDRQSIADLSLRLQEFLSPGAVNESYPTMEQLPESLRCVMREEYITTVSEAFSKTSHEGPFEAAIISGMALLDVYRLIYPPNYPQIGLHLLELAKTAWNALVSSGTTDRVAAQQIRNYLNQADRILQVFGSEGDTDGPLNEIQTLTGLLEADAGV